MNSPSTQALKSFLEASSPDTWLNQELTNYVSNDSFKASEEHIYSLRAEAENDLETFLNTEISPSAVTSVVLAFVPVTCKDASEATGGIFLKAPSAISLLDLASQNCEVYDQVVLTHRFASGEEITVSKIWPFSLTEAIDLLSPSFSL